MKTEIWMIHSYGAWEIAFKKKFDLPFTPFVGLFILDQVGSNEVQIECTNNQYKTTMFFYYTKTKSFTIDIKEHWEMPVSDETIDNILKYFMACGWKREDTTNIDDLKELMKNNQ
jgi:hypothetical protein